MGGNLEANPFPPPSPSIPLPSGPLTSPPEEGIDLPQKDFWREREGGVGRWIEMKCLLLLLVVLDISEWISPFLRSGADSLNDYG